MSKLEDFLTEKEEQEIVEAIRVAEQNTSGEIRVHIEHNYQNDIFDHVVEVFHYLKMDNTKLKNGVLIYVAVDRKEFVIYGDDGINNKVDKTFWNTTRDTISHSFQVGEFSKGLIYGIQKAGEELSKYFPWIHNDLDELDNSISKN